MKKILRFMFIFLFIFLLIPSVNVFASAKDDIDLSKFDKVKDVTKYAGVSDDYIYIANSNSYLFIYYDETDDCFCYISKPDDKDEKFVKIDDLNSFITDSKNYSSADGNYNYVYYDYKDTMNNRQLKSFYLFILNDNKFYNLGFYKDFDDFAKNKLDMSDKKPVLDVKIKDGKKNTKDIVVNYKSGNTASPVKCINLYLKLDDEDYIELDSRDIDLKDGNKGSVTFSVDTNDMYIIKCTADPSYFSDDLTEVYEFTVKDLKTDTDKLLNKINKDKKAPKITFSKFPKSAIDGNEVEITMYSDEKALLGFNGNFSDDNVKEFKVTVIKNGDYSYYAEDSVGNKTEGTLKIDFFKEDNSNINSTTITDSNRDSYWEDANKDIEEYNNNKGTTTNDSSSNSGNNNKEGKLPQTGLPEISVFILIGLFLVLIGASLLASEKFKK